MALAEHDRISRSLYGTITLSFASIFSRREGLGLALAARGAACGRAHAPAKYHDPAAAPTPARDWTRRQRSLCRRCVPAFRLGRTPEPALPSPCVWRLTADIANRRATAAELSRRNGCGIADPVRLSGRDCRRTMIRIARHAARDIALHHAEPVARWLREDVAPIAATLGARSAALPTSIFLRIRGRTAWSARCSANTQGKRDRYPRH